jgi:predicted AlkP superfamily phosphohydrolase/phosphomutase
LTQSESSPRVVILGLDGVSWPLVQKLTEEGVMPRLKALAEESNCGPMLSTLPEISPVAWTTFFTGRSPGDHGIYGFTEFEAESYKVRFNSSGQIRVPALWDWLGLKNKKSVVLNVPMTYPAQALSGVMVSGFMALNIDRAGFPSWVVDFLKKNNYRLEADFEMVHQDRQTFLDDLDLTLAGRMDLIERFWPENWDLFFLVLTDPDRLNHFFYREYEEKGSIYQYFLDYYHRLDRAVGRIHDLAERLAHEESADLCLVLLSDHGFTGVKEEFHLNRWLKAQGFQDSAGPEALALALDPTRIYLNRAPRFPSGRLNGSDAKMLVQKLTNDLMAEPAVESVFKRSELFSGQAIDMAPDMVVKPAAGFEFKAKFTPGPVYSPSPLMGTHTREGAFYLVHDFSGRKEKPMVDDILDLAQYVFTLLDVKQRDSHEIQN